MTQLISCHNVKNKCLSLFSLFVLLIFIEAIKPFSSLYTCMQKEFLWFQHAKSSKRIKDDKLN